MGQNYYQVAFECKLQCVLGIRVAKRKPLEERASISVFLVVSLIWFRYIKMLGFSKEITTTSNLYLEFFKEMKMTWYFVISAVWAGIVYGPCLWQLSACRRLLTVLSHGSQTKIISNFIGVYCCCFRSGFAGSKCRIRLGWFNPSLIKRKIINQTKL